MNALIADVKDRAGTLFLFVASIWAVSVINFVLPLHLERFGVHPRSLFGLVGFVVAPWVHSGMWHLVSNTMPLFVLGGLAMWPKREGFWAAILGSMLGAGVVAWLIGGPHTVHIGASGVVFGLGGFVVARGYYARRFFNIALALAAVSLYGMSMLLGVLPIYPGVSWESHLGGAIGGILTAKLMYSTNS